MAAVTPLCKGSSSEPDKFSQNSTLRLGQSRSEASAKVMPQQSLPGHPAHGSQLLGKVASLKEGQGGASVWEDESNV